MFILDFEMVAQNEHNPTFEIGQKAICLDDSWPDTISLMATKKWSNISINGTIYELQTSFFSGEMPDLDHELVAVFLSSIRTSIFEAWASRVGTNFARNEITKTWLDNQDINADLTRIFRTRCSAILTFPSSRPGPEDVRSLHLGFILSIND